MKVCTITDVFGAKILEKVIRNREPLDKEISEKLEGCFCKRAIMVSVADKSKSLKV
ncbi:MAG: hypothetical protein IPH28_25695 [Cytophagaceae bacterium]|nr:hypothetical protein [Cytophagaceae bacterium]